MRYPALHARSLMSPQELREHENRIMLRKIREGIWTDEQAKEVFPYLFKKEEGVLKSETPTVQ